MENPEIPYETENLRFKLERFNPRRKMRGAPCVEISLHDDSGEITCLWMTKDDILQNIDEFGHHDALNEGLKYYL